MNEENEVVSTEEVDTSAANESIIEETETDTEVEKTNVLGGSNEDGADDADSPVEFTDGSPDEEDEEYEEDEEEQKIERTKAFSKRLKEEKEKIIRTEESKSQEKLDKVAKSRGFDSWEELEQYDRQEKLQNMGISDSTAFDEVLNEAISKNPFVEEAKKIVEAQKQKEQADIIESSVKEISKLDPDIKTIDDVIQLKEFDALFDLVKKGNSLVDAYKIVAFDKITNKKMTKAAQNTMNNINSKNHLKSVKGTHSVDVVVPEDVLAHYKKNNPNMTDDEIRKHYNKYLNN